MCFPSAHQYSHVCLTLCKVCWESIHNHKELRSLPYFLLDHRHFSCKNVIGSLSSGIPYGFIAISSPCNVWRMTRYGNNSFFHLVKEERNLRMGPNMFIMVMCLEAQTYLLGGIFISYAQMCLSTASILHQLWAFLEEAALMCLTWGCPWRILEITGRAKRQICRRRSQ